MSIKRDENFIIENVIEDQITQNEQLSAITEHVSISWHNISVFSKPKERNCFSRKQKESPIQILKDVTGHVKSGQLLAIMGASGAGKTTLMNVLTGRNLSNVQVKGVVQLNNKTVDISTITALSAYVQEDDLFIGTLTVREHLQFQAQVRMDQHISKSKRFQRVEDVIKEFGLTKCGDNRIGTKGIDKGISSGEMKRLAFASELLTNPSIMFCDEPTSGLDSFMAQSVVSVMKNMAANGRTVICTIHQPSSAVFAMFDHVLLLADGRVAFLGKSAEGLEFFAGLGYHSPPNFNPADFYIEELAVVPGDVTESKKKINYICDQFSVSSYAKEVPEPAIEKRGSFLNLHEMTDKKLRYKANWNDQFCALLWRSHTTLIREPKVTKFRIFQTLVMSIMLGLFYLNNGGDHIDQNGIMNLNGAIFQLLIHLVFDNTYSAINSFCVEIPIFLREHNNGMYRVDVYFISKMIAQLPLMIFFPVFFVSLYYFMVGLNSNFTSFLMCVFISLIVSNCAGSFGYLISSISSSIRMAVAMTTPILIPLLLAGGFFLNNRSVPPYFIWIKYISFFYYGNEALMINQWKDITNATIICPELNDNANGTKVIRCFEDGPMILKSFNFDESNLWKDIILTFVLLISLRILAYFVLLKRSKKK